MGPNGPGCRRDPLRVKPGRERGQQMPVFGGPGPHLNVRDADGSQEPAQTFHLRLYLHTAGPSSRSNANVKYWPLHAR